MLHIKLFGVWPKSKYFGQWQINQNLLSFGQYRKINMCDNTTKNKKMIKTKYILCVDNLFKDKKVRA